MTDFPPALTCRGLKFLPQGYYRWARHPISYRDYENAYLTNALVDAHRKDPAFGHRFLADELERKGMAIGERRVWRLCSQASLWSSFVKKSRSSKRPLEPGQFTSAVFTGVLQEAGVTISMDGAERALDNVFIKRLWRTLEYDHIYLNPADSGTTCREGISEFLYYYNQERPHSSLNDQTPNEVYYQSRRNQRVA